MRSHGARIRTIVRREYGHRVRNKWFLITTFGFPLLIAALMVLPVWLTGDLEEEAPPLQVGVVDRAGLDAERVAELITREDTRLFASVAEVPAGATAEELKELLEGRETDAYLVLDPGVREGEPGVLLSRRAVSPMQQEGLRRAFQRAALEAELGEEAVDEERRAAVLRASESDIQLTRIRNDERDGDAAAVILAMIFTGILYVMFVVYGQSIMRGVQEEKTSEIAEILLSSVRPWELMTGKIMGIGAVGLTQLAIWFGLVAAVAAWGLAAAGPRLAELVPDPAALLPVPVAAAAGAFLVFFLLGFFLYAAGFAAVGAIVGDEEEAQQVMFPLLFLIVIPFILALVGVESPQADWFRAASHFPFFAPILMVVRVTLGAVPLWEVLLSLVVLVAATAIFAWVSGRIYRVGILMKGKRPNIEELVRWIRYG